MDRFTVFEKNPYLGGKLSSWREDNAEVEHGFHAFFRHYYGQRYAVLRVWLRDQVLDAFAFANRLDADARAHLRTTGAVLELHCYSLPDTMAREQAAAALKLELARFLPGFDPARVVRRHLQVRDDFAAFHVGLSSARPQVETSLPGLVLAGDWVALPLPAMLMEAAHTSGRLAANALCRGAGVRTYPVSSVPPLGLLRPLAKHSPAPQSPLAWQRHLRG